MLRLRSATLDDCRLFWEWANEPGTRAASFSSNRIPWEDHTHWFGAKLGDPNCRLYIALLVDSTETSQPVGQARFDLDQDEAVISISVDSRFRGRGLGSEIISLATRYLFETSAVSTIHAYVKRENARSLHAFEKAGYGQMGAELISGCEAVHMSIRRTKLMA